MTPGNPEEHRLNIGGLEIAIKVYAYGSAEFPVIALHGWMDNAASFDALAPHLNDIQLITFDLPGHGLSSHRQTGAEYYIWSYVQEVIAIADHFNIQRFSLLGHSMGGAVACLLASLFPARIKQLALLDSLGPMSTGAAEAPTQMRRALKQQRSAKLRYYPSREAAVQARARKGLGFEAARMLGERGIAKDDNGFYWSNDQRLARVNLLSLTEDQVNAFLKEILCPVCLIVASSAWEERQQSSKQRLSDLSEQTTLEIHTLEGSHHQHLEGQVEGVAKILNHFFISESGTEIRSG